MYTVSWPSAVTCIPSSGGAGIPHWSRAHTRNGAVVCYEGVRRDGSHFASALRFRSLFRVTLVNWLLIVVTLGLYWPFAEVRKARLKLHAMSVDIDAR